MGAPDCGNCRYQSQARHSTIALERWSISAALWRPRRLFRRFSFLPVRLLCFHFALVKHWPNWFHPNKKQTQRQARVFLPVFRSNDELQSNVNQDRQLLPNCLTICGCVCVIQGLGHPPVYCHLVLSPALLCLFFLAGKGWRLLCVLPSHQIESIWLLAAKDFAPHLLFLYESQTISVPMPPIPYSRNNLVPRSLKTLIGTT
jgi:hypothetical protein